MSKQHSENRKEVGVCGTGKHRVININPLLLTPASASKIYSGREKSSNYSRKVNKKILDDASHDNAQAYLFEDTLNLPVDQIQDSPSALNLWRSSSHNESVASSIVTLDDVHDLSESDVTDISDLGSLASLSNITINSVQNEKSEPMQTSGNSTRTRSDALFNLDKNSSKMRKYANSPSEAHSFNKHGRVIEISPSLLLPVTPVPSKIHQQQICEKPNKSSQDFHSRNTSTISTNSSHTSLSDIQSLKQSNVDDTKTHQNIEKSDDKSAILQAECERLQQSLKLADADIAILVSSKQQLQLEFHNQEEKVKTLSRNLLDEIQKNKEHEARIEELSRIMQENQEKYEVEMQTSLQKYNSMEIEFKNVQNSLDMMYAEKDAKKIDIEVLNETLHKYKVKSEQAEQELKEVKDKNIVMENLLQEASVKGEGAEQYVKHLKEENNKFSKKIFEFEQENMILRVKNKTQETKMTDLQHTNQELAEKSAKHELRYREIDADNVTLTTRLNSATKEKSELNSAVTRLRGDLSKVEASFARLKQQMLDKSKVAEEQTFKRQELEERVKYLSIQNEKLSNVNAEIRIRDKNVQIEQLLSKSRTSTIEKTKLENQIEKLQAQIDANRKSWVAAIEKEKTNSRILQEKDDLIGLKSNENDKLSQMLSSEKQKCERMASLLQINEKAISEVKMKLKETEESVDKLVLEKKSMLSIIEEYKQKSDSEIRSNKRNEKEFNEEKMRLEAKITHLEDQIESLQKDLVLKEANIQTIHQESLQRLSDDKSNQESHPIHQLQLLSELQSTRRELSHEKQQLIQENKNLSKSNSDAELTIDELSKSLENEKQKVKQLQNDLILKAKESEMKFESQITALEKQVQDAENSRSRLEEELFVIKDHNNVLSQQLGTLQIHNGKLSDDLKEKIKELEDITSQYNTAKEEMNILKQELSSVMLQLTDAIHNNENSESVRQSAEKESLLKEMEVLRSTVMRQQQYAVSLSKHYEKWAQDAAEKMKNEIVRIKVSAKDERERIRNELLQSGDELHPSTDSSTQTDHDQLQIPLQPADQQEVLEAMKKEQVSLSNLLTNEQKHVVMLQDQLKQLSEEIKSKDRMILTIKQEYANLANKNKQLLHATQLLKEKLDKEAKSDTEIRRDGFTQTDHNQDSCVVCEKCASIQKIQANKIDVSSQTEHDNETIGYQADQYQTENNEASILEEEKLRLMEENTQQAEMIAVLQQRINSWTAIDSPILQNVGTQTSHQDEVILHSPPISLLEDSSTQTQHDNELVGSNVNYEMENRISDLKLFYDEKLSQMENEKHILQETLSQLKMSLSEHRSTHDSTSSSVQTEHDLELISSSVHQSILRQTVSTQTNHDDEMLIPVQGTTANQFLEQQRINQKLHEELENMRNMMQDQSMSKVITTSSTQTIHDFDTISSHQLLAPVKMYESQSSQTYHNNEVLLPNQQLMEIRVNELEQTNHDLLVDLMSANSTIDDLKSSHSKLLEDSGTQTSHDEERLISSNQEINTMLLEDSSTQTDHNDLSVSFSYNDDQVKDELKYLRLETENLQKKLYQAQEENEKLSKIISDLQHKSGDRKQYNKGTQTAHETEIITVQHITSSSHDAFSQTDHENDPVRSSSNVPKQETEIYKQSKAIDLEIEEITEQPDKTPEIITCPVCGRIKNTDHDVAGKPPSPMTILRTMESRKLRAYKKTVYILKKNLKTAEDKISNLQAELKILRPSTDTKKNSVELPDSEKISMKNENSTEKIEQLQHEIYKVKKASALQAEDSRRKSLAERKILEAKVLNLNERLQGLSDVNQQLRNSVEVLQVKLTEKTRLSDIALKEKNRYQMRSRRLQASLRSLSWITGTQDKSMFSENGCDLSGISFEGSLNDSASSETFVAESSSPRGAGGDASVKSRTSSTGLSIGNLPASVVEIEESLKDLQSEIIALEKQMQEHNTAVKRSKNQWTRLKQESNDVASFSRSRATETNSQIANNDNSNVEDHITQISEIV